MDRRLWYSLLSCSLLIGIGAVLQYGDYVDFLGRAQSGSVPAPAITGVVVVLLFVVWVVAMIGFAKLLYRAWKLIDSYVFRFWNLIRPDSPIIRFGVILTILVLVFAFGPLVALQWVGIDSSSQDVSEEVGLNNTNSSSDETAVENQSRAVIETTEIVQGVHVARTDWASRVGFETLPA